MRVGPVYAATRSQEGTPVYPDVQILVDLPLSAGGVTLTPGAFRLRADGGKSRPATRVQTLTASGHGMAVAVVLDVSGSMQGRPLNAIRTGLARFAGDAGPYDSIAIETLADDSRWEVNWGDSPDQIRRAIGELASRGKLTRLWDGLLLAVNKLPETPAARRVIAISDGHDEGSAHSLDEVIEAYRNHLTPVDAIGVTRSDPAYLANLQRLAEETGGQFQTARSETDLERLAGGGIERLRALPVVGFRLDDSPPDGKSHEFEVSWLHDGTESSAKVTATLPSPGSLARGQPRVPLSLAIAAIALLFALFLFGRQRAGRVVTVPAQDPPPLVAEICAPEVIRPQAAESVPSARNLPRDVVQPQPVSAGPSERTHLPARSRTQLTSSFPEPCADRPAAWLFGEEGPGAGEWFAIDAPAYWIGGGDNNHLRLTGDPTVSGNHACIVFESDVLGIFDYASTNGTRVNGEIVRDYRRLLQPGDRIRIGRSVFVLHADHMVRTDGD